MTEDPDNEVGGLQCCQCGTGYAADRFLRVGSRCRDRSQYHDAKVSPPPEGCPGTLWPYNEDVREIVDVLLTGRRITNRLWRRLDDRLLAKVARDLFDAGSPVDLLSVNEALRGDEFEEARERLYAIAALI